MWKWPVNQISGALLETAIIPSTSNIRLIRIKPALKIIKDQAVTTYINK